MLHAEQRAEHIGIERRGVAVGRLLGHRAGLAFGAGAVDGRIQTTEARDGPIDQTAHIVFAAHIGTNEFRFAAEAAQAQRPTPGRLSSWRPETTTRLPSRASAKAAARPIPVNAPVIKTTGVLISATPFYGADTPGLPARAETAHHRPGAGIPRIAAGAEDLGFLAAPRKTL